jgi:hypothetical protein
MVQDDQTNFWHSENSTSYGFRWAAIIKMRLFVFCVLMWHTKSNEISRIDKNPYYQHLPDCSKDNRESWITKSTKAKGIICPMVRDEVGFLSEWVAYYELHGFNHIRFYDDKSGPDAFVELEPWIKSGFVSIVSNWTSTSLGLSPHVTKNNKFMFKMAQKFLIDVQCKKYAIKRGFHFYLSLDIDEYVIPYKKHLTIVDTVVESAQRTGRAAIFIGKSNFASTPHILEPINLLTLEAYQTRMKEHNKMNYYTSVQPKFGVLLNFPPEYNEVEISRFQFTNVSLQFITFCCGFHGCQSNGFGSDKLYGGVKRYCKVKFGDEAWRVHGKGRRWESTCYINHYSRSLEKYGLKQSTWETASGEAAKGYDLANFFARSTGWTHDSTALRYTCQLRSLLQNRTGDAYYLRPGDLWYRNPEFGRIVSDPRKRGRNGAKKGYFWREGNPYHYKGGKQGVDLLVADSEDPTNVQDQDEKVPQESVSPEPNFGMRKRSHDAPGHPRKREGKRGKKRLLPLMHNEARAAGTAEVLRI